MTDRRKLMIDIDKNLAERLSEAAQGGGVTPERLAAECVAQHYEIALRHLVLVERFEAIDAQIGALAEFVGAATQDAGAVDLSHICCYRREQDAQ